MLAISGKWMKRSFTHRKNLSRTKGMKVEDTIDLIPNPYKQLRSGADSFSKDSTYNLIFKPDL